MRALKEHHLPGKIGAAHRADELREVGLGNLRPAFQQQRQRPVGFDLQRADLLLQLVGEEGLGHCQRIALAEIGQVHRAVRGQILIAADCRHLHLHRVDLADQLVQPRPGAFGVERGELVVRVLKKEGQLQRFELLNLVDQALVLHKGEGGVPR